MYKILTLHWRIDMNKDQHQCPTCGVFWPNDTTPPWITKNKKWKNKKWVISSEDKAHLDDDDLSKRLYQDGSRVP